MPSGHPTPGPIDPDDPRHGTNPGYLAGCRLDCCKAGHATYRRNYRTRRYLQRVDSLRVDGTGTRRRIQALAALGWSLTDLDARIGAQRSYCYRVLRSSGEVYRTTASKVAAVYDDLCMSFPPETTASERIVAARNRSHARNRGWVPPLAWDDIDDPAETPQGVEDDRHTTAADDDSAVERILGGAWRLKCSPRVKTEVCRRWHAAGRSLNELSRLTGWRTTRYYVIREHVDQEGVAC